MFIDTDEIKSRLFDDELIRERVRRDYGLSKGVATAETFVMALLEALDQKPVENPHARCYSNKDIFKAAVRALGSNSRTWASFIKREPKLRQCLNDYDPHWTRADVKTRELTEELLKQCLPGQSSRNDARAILKWAQLLDEVEDYYGFVRGLGCAFQERAKNQDGKALNNHELLLCIVGYLGQPPKNWAGEKYLRVHLPHEQRKTPGMSYVLVSEFMRNLGWNGFKPDRHVQRLFNRWFPNGRALVLPKVERLASLIGRNRKALSNYLTYSLIGAAAVRHETKWTGSLDHITNPRLATTAIKFRRVLSG